MASDSRLTLNSEQITPQGQSLLLAAGMSDSNYKTFLAFNKIGISTFGQADIKGAPIGGFIETFIREFPDENQTISDFANKLNEYFRTYNPIPDTGFHISGYEEVEGKFKQKIFRVTPFHNLVTLINPENTNGDTQGASWDGEGDILTRLLQPVFTVDSNGQNQPIPYFPIPWQFFTLQDAIDFAVYAIRTTIDSVRFQPRPKTVGGPIDILVIKPTESLWISKKELQRN